MGNFLAIMFLIACSDDFAACTPQTRNVALYQNEKNCEENLKPALLHTPLQAPQMFGTCVKIKPTNLNKNNALIWRINKQGDLFVRVETLAATSPTFIP
ncbi:hypothetical protein [Bartonella sp. DGB2]|uniref:hypothetical protein n=1 Tax=Bartonella sp. DGB2 TaxID=3388426 RepID=UPI00398FD22D